ncbi:MAG TPA: sugar ABC transporter permease [Acidilobales archaeon]|nr:sugar ABC transporter permease [Acidilobales archaeon]
MNFNSKYWFVIEKYLPYILIAPALAYMLFFIGYPLAQGIILAFIKEGKFTLENIEYLLHSPFSKFFEALTNTLLITLIVIPIQTLVALGLAMLLNIKFWGRNAALYIVVLPLTISDVAAGLIWYTMLSPNGFFNKIMMNIGLIKSPIYFFGYQYRSMEFLAIIITEVWRATAIVFIILFAGLQMISDELLEAAEVFGASTWQRLRHIVLPLLKPSLQAALIIRTLFAFQIFGVVWTLAGRDIPILAGEAYYEQVELHHTGVAALYALIIAAISLSLGFLYLKLFKAKYLEAGT